MEWDTPNFDGNGNSLKSTGKSEYTYNGKEFQDDFDIDLHYYGYRIYDPSIGRFTGVDPIAEQYAFVSGFNYAENEPIANIDLHGLQKIRYDVAWSDPGLVAAGASHSETRQFQKVSGQTTGLALAVVAPGPEDAAMAVVGATKIGGAILKAVGKFADEAFSSVKNFFKKGDESASGLQRARHHTDKAGADGILNDGAINPSRPAQGNDVGVDVELSPFGKSSTASEELGAAGSGKFIEFDIKPGEVTPTPMVNPNRNSGRIVTDKPLDISNRNPKVKKQ